VVFVLVSNNTVYKDYFSLTEHLPPAQAEELIF